MSRPLILLALCAAAFFAFTPASPLLIYNGSPSAPRGFYLRSATPPSIGVFVTVNANAVAPAYAAVRQFDGPRNWFIKRAAAGAGTRVCAEANVVQVGATQLLRQAKDSAGRPLPAWSGCRVLTTDELFLIGDSSDSFDSRYWGPVRLNEIEGVWTPLRSSDPGA